MKSVAMLALCFAAFLPAQQRPAFRDPGQARTLAPPIDAVDDRVETADALAMEKARQRAAALAVHEFREKIRAFAREMNLLTAKYKDGPWDLKQAQIVTRSWRRMHADAAWIEKEKRE